MKKKLLIGTVLLAVTVAMAGCMCTAEKSAVDRMQGTHDKVSAKLMKYVKADAIAQVAAKTMTQADADAFVDDWQKLVDSDQRNIDALKRALGE